MSSNNDNDVHLSNEELKIQIDVAAYFIARNNSSYDDLCWRLAETQLKIQSGQENIKDEIIKEKAEIIFNSHLHYDVLCFLIAELDIYQKHGYFLK